MGKYKETNIQGDSYVRSYRITIENGLNHTPSIKFDEEMVINIEGIQTIIPYGNVFNQCSEDFITSGSGSNLNEEFDIIVPATFLPTGETLTYLEVHNILHSLYFHVAQKRDERMIPISGSIE